MPGSARPAVRAPPRSAVAPELVNDTIAASLLFAAVADSNAGQLLEYLDDCRAVFFVEALGARHLIDLLRHIGEQKGHAKPFGKRRLQLLVLVRNVDRAARREVALQHAWHPVLELHRRASADSDHLIDLLRIEPGL